MNLTENGRTRGTLTEHPHTENKILFFKRIFIYI